MATYTKILLSIIFGIQVLDFGCGLECAICEDFYCDFLTITNCTESRLSETNGFLRDLAKDWHQPTGQQCYCLHAVIRPRNEKQIIYKGCYMGSKKDDCGRKLRKNIDLVTCDLCRTDGCNSGSVKSFKLIWWCLIAFLMCVASII